VANGKRKREIAKIKMFLPKAKKRLAKEKARSAISEPRSANKNRKRRAENVDPVLCLRLCRLW
jgi:hypothetical protein